MDHKADRTQPNHKSDLTYQVLHAVQLQVGVENGECSLEEIIKKCATYPEAEVFAEIDRLSRRGDLRIMYRQKGQYAVRLAKEGKDA